MATRHHINFWKIIQSIQDAEVTLAWYQEYSIHAIGREYL